MSRPNQTAVHRRWDWDYPVIARADGIYLWDTTGKRYIDGSGGSSVVTSIGHGVKEIHCPEGAMRRAFIVVVDGWRWAEQIRTRLLRRNVVGY